MRRLTAVAAAAACSVFAAQALADGFIGMNQFSGGENVLTFNSTDMTTLSHPTADIGSGVLVTDSGGGTGNGAWRGNTDWSAYFSNIPGSSQGRALADSWGASDIKFDFTGAGNPQRVGLLLSTFPVTTWTVRVYDPSNNLVATTNVTMPGQQQAVFVGYERTAGVGYLRISDVENGYITLMDDLRMERPGTLIERFTDPMIGWTNRWFYQNSNAGNYYVAQGNCDENNRGNNPCGVWITDTQVCGGGNGGPVSEIVFDPGFAAQIEFFAFDLSAYIDQRLTIYDVSDNVLLDVPTVVRTNNNCAGHRYSVGSNNGISRIRMDSSGHSGGQIEGNTAWDNVEVHLAASLIATYDITDAARDGFGNWHHNYNGSIVDTGNFSANGFNFTRANYRNGAGTLNDGSPGTSVADTQLFANNADARPRITLHLKGNHFVNDLTLFSFDGGNSIPGRIRSVDVTIGGLTQTFATSEPTTNDEFIDLSNSVLSTIPTNTVVLSNFTHDGGNSLNEMFCIGEIGVSGRATTRFGLTVTGACPGNVNVNWSSAQPNVTLALIFSFNTGNFVIPFGPCQGTVLGLGGSNIRLVRTFNSGPGSGTLISNAPPIACGRYLQMHDLPACDLSNVFRIP